jgi:hypothetical protein
MRNIYTARRTIMLRPYKIDFEVGKLIPIIEVTSNIDAEPIGLLKLKS